jgi:hypothetical protein
VQSERHRLSIAEACREVHEHETSATTALCQDPAIRLMVYQLASICDVASYSIERYVADEAACKNVSPSLVRQHS